MENFADKYGLDARSSMIMSQYVGMMPLFKRMEEVLSKELEHFLAQNNIYVTALETRVKTEESLAGKLDKKGFKYETIFDLTDIVGARVITFYTDEVDKIAAMVDRIFEVDWANSIDKRKMHQLDSFGYNSLHYICRIPKKMFFDPQYPEINEIRFELQMRTALQHVWATINHDIGYKTGIEIPVEHLRNINRLAGMLELADEQFSAIRQEFNDYRRRVQELVSSGNFNDVPLNGDTFRSYLELRPFDKLLKKIAAVNQAEIHNSSVTPYLNVLFDLGFKTLGEVDRMIHENSEDAYQLATFQLAMTDLDIISSTIAIQDLCEVYILKHGGGVDALTEMFDKVNGKSEGNSMRAESVVNAAKQLSFMNRKKLEK